MATSCIDLTVDDPPLLQWKFTDWIGHGKTYYPRDVQVPPHIAEARSVVLKNPLGILKNGISRGLMCESEQFFAFFMPDGKSGRNFGKWPEAGFFPDENWQI